MKKFIAVFLTLVMLLAMNINAFAAGSTTLTLESTARTYNGYRLLDLTISLKTGAHPDGCNGTNHVDGCYNYSYTVNEEYRTVLQNEVFEKGTWAEGTKPATAGAVTDEQILNYLTEQTGDESSDSLRAVADRLYRAILDDDKISPEETGLTGTISVDLAQGYWMFADVTTLSGNNDANSLIVVDTKGLGSMTIRTKVAIPTVEKKVKDIADSTDGDIKDNAWQDSADHDIGDTVPFKLTATMPENISSYQTYKIVFHDTLSAGLTLDADSMKVYMYASKAEAEADVALTAPDKDVTASFNRIETVTDGCNFELGCENVLGIGGVTKDTVFVVYYEAELNDSAEVGATGNPNVVYLEYSNNPYGTETGKTTEDKVTVFTYELVINKVDGQGNALKGAGFTLSKKDVNGVYTVIGEEIKGDDMTTFTWTGLDDGEYKLVESTVPAGYNKMADVTFSISATHSETADEPALITLTSTGFGTADPATGTVTENIVNNTGTVLPETGAEGTVKLITISSAIVMMAVIVMVTRKRMSVYED